MDLQDQLRKLFPDHEEAEPAKPEKPKTVWMQEEPIICKYEKRKGKPVTILEGYNGAANDFKVLARELKTLLGVGGSAKNDTIIIQGDYRKEIMAFLKEKGFNTKRVGG